ncbi:MAG: hypothetical protein WAL85_06685, partial [Candidatus Korobacteraceae bacterium]
MKSSLSNCSKENSLARITPEGGRGLRRALLATVLAFATMAVGAPHYLAAQADSKSPGPFSAPPLAQPQTSATPEGVPSTTPTVVLDDAQKPAPGP